MHSCDICNAPFAPENDGARLCPACAATPHAATPHAPQAEPEGAATVLRLVPKATATAQTNAAQCRRLLLNALQRVEAGEITSVVLVCDLARGDVSAHWSPQADLLRTRGALMVIAQRICG